MVRTKALSSALKIIYLFLYLYNKKRRTRADDKEDAERLFRIVGHRQERWVQTERQCGLVGQVEVGLQHVAVEGVEGREDSKLSIGGAGAADVGKALGVRRRLGTSSTLVLRIHNTRVLSYKIIIIIIIIIIITKK
jgi:hypothetical protein